MISCVKIVRQAQALVIERLGAYQATWGTGLHFKLPIVDRVARRVDMKEQVVDFAPQPVITKDNVTMRIDTVVFYQITDPKMFCYGVANPIMAIENLTATTLRNIIGDLELDQTLTSRETINTKMRASLDVATDPWGIKVNRVELKNIIPPAAIQDAMEKQMKAERERREAILRAEGEKKSTILVAEGHKESAILDAEAEKQAAILRAEAQKEAMIREAEGQAEAITKNDIVAAYLLLEESYENGGKLLVAGNGGSAADAEHIVGELMKGFKLPRKPETDFAEKLVAENQELGAVLAENLQGALPAIALDGHPALSTAYMNDCEPLLCFAQQVNGYGKSGDVFLGISTSGNSKNVLFAATTAHAKGMKVIGLTGAKDSKLKEMSDVCIKAPQTETYMIQELHLPIYHCLCLMLEDQFFA